MIRKRRLVQLCGVLLYLGPILAGLAGHGTAALPAFAAMLLLWSVLMRPQDWPANPARWRNLGVVAAAMGRVIGMAVLAALCLALARGVAVMTGVQMPLPLLLPVTVSALAVVVARGLWAPDHGPRFDGVLDEVMRRIQR